MELELTRSVKTNRSTIGELDDKWGIRVFYPGR
jgi:hypothetical protein